MIPVKWQVGVFLILLTLQCQCFGQSSFTFVDEQLPNTNATEHICETGTYNDTDGVFIYDFDFVGPVWNYCSTASASPLLPKSLATASCQSHSSPDWQPKVDILSQYIGGTLVDGFWIEDMAWWVEAGTGSRIRKGWVNRDITPPENVPGTPCLGADWKFEFGNVTQGGGFSFEGGLWKTQEGQHWHDAELLCEIYGNNGLFGYLPYSGQQDSNGNEIGGSGWLIRNSLGQNQPGTYYTGNPNSFSWEDRFPQIQPGTVLWIMGPPDANGDPTPHAIFGTGHYLLGQGAGGGMTTNDGLGFYKFTPSLLASWNGGGGNN